MTRRKLIRHAWTLLRWMWAKRNEAVMFEVTVIRAGRESADYRSMATRGMICAIRHGINEELNETSIEEQWAKLQREHGEVN